MSTDFYKALEERFRGPPDLIKERLRVYLPFVEPLKTLYPECKALDLGCGRGEWLELLRSSGFDAYGVDINEEMVMTCRTLGLNVEQDEAISVLRKLPDETYAVISAIHLIEHLQFSDIQTLLQEALRVLKPAGLLILETQNPENFWVANVTFHLDPTHVRPVPPLLLEFLAEFYGFYRTKIFRLQERPELNSSSSLSLLDVLTGVSPDYAVIMQKKAPQKMLAMFDHVFAIEKGINLERLASRYDAQIQAQIKALEAQLTEARTRTEAEVRALQTKLKEKDQRLEELSKQIEGLLVYARITSSVGLLVRSIKELRKFPTRLKRMVLRLALRCVKDTVRWAVQKPRLRAIGKKLLSRSPTLKARIRQLITPHSLPQLVVPKASKLLLPESARRVYRELKEELERAASKERS